MPEQFYSMNEKDTWQTPDDLLDIITRHVDITLDPCAGPETSIGQEENYRLEDGDDGLEDPWFGTVFVNPPFSYMDKWTQRVMEEKDNEDVNLIILLSADSTDVQSWWHGRVTEANYVWFSEGRIKFIDPDTGEQKNSPTAGTCLSFYGEISEGLKSDLRREGWLTQSA